MNFAKLLDPRKHRLDAVEKVYKCNAFCFENGDTEGLYHKIFPKEATISLRDNRWIIDFEGYCSYYADDLETFNFIDNDLFCIDAGGRNHGVDYPVYVRSSVVKHLVEECKNSALAHLARLYTYVNIYCNLDGEMLKFLIATGQYLMTQTNTEKAEDAVIKILGEEDYLKI